MVAERAGRGAHRQSAPPLAASDDGGAGDGGQPVSSPAAYPPVPSATSPSGARHRKELGRVERITWYAHTTVKVSGVVLLLGLIGSIIYATENKVAGRPEGAADGSAQPVDTTTATPPAPPISMTTTAAVPPGTAPAANNHTSRPTRRPRPQSTRSAPGPAPDGDWQGSMVGPIMGAIRSGMQSFPPFSR